MIPSEHLDWTVERLKGHFAEREYLQLKTKCLNRRADVQASVLEVLSEAEPGVGARLRGLYPKSLVGKKAMLGWRVPELEGVVPAALHRRLPSELNRGVMPFQPVVGRFPEEPSLDDVAAKRMELKEFRASSSHSRVVGQVVLATKRKVYGRQQTGWTQVMFHLSLEGTPVLFVYAQQKNAELVSGFLGRLLGVFSWSSPQGLKEYRDDHLIRVKVNEEKLRAKIKAQEWPMTMIQGRHVDDPDVHVRLASARGVGRRDQIRSIVQEIECPHCGEDIREDHLKRQSAQPADRLGILYAHMHTLDSFVERSDFEIATGSPTLHITTRHTVSEPAFRQFANQMMTL